MSSINALGVCLPRYRLPLAAYRPLGVSPPGGMEEKAVARRDEDALTLAVEAARGALSGLQRGASLDLYLGTSTPPVGGRSIGSTVAAALGLGPRCFLLEAAGARAGMSALLCAIRAGGGLAVASDLPRGRPGSEGEAPTGAGAAALRVDEGGGFAEVEAVASYTEEVGAGRYEAGGEARDTGITAYVREEYERLTRGALEAVLGEAGVTPGDLGRVVLQGPDPRTIQRTGKRLGFTEAQMEPAMLLSRLGDTGAAQPILGLVHVLESGGRGQRILVLSYGSGGASDALLLRQTREPPGRLLQRAMARARPIELTTYLQWRGVV
ncbi:MAG: hypothetical protein HY558_00500 [Euryarchaeota archaeon]|nr:hypothetical protein [Euryarchaeota archaeon]